MSKKFRKKQKGAARLPATTVAPLYVLKEPKCVMQINGVSVYGSSVFVVSKIEHLALIIDLSGLPTHETQLVTGNKAALLMLPEVLFADVVPTVYIDWQDGSAHSLDTVWWEELIGVIEGLPGGTAVGVCCVGGTGRTGTALACLVGLSQGLPADADPVEWLREHYYDDAVETERQMWYIEGVTGAVINVEPSDSLYPPVSYPPAPYWHQTTEPVLPAASYPQGMVTGPLGGPSSLGASDHTGS